MPGTRQIVNEMLGLSRLLRCLKIVPPEWNSEIFSAVEIKINIFEAYSYCIKNNIKEKKDESFRDLQDKLREITILVSMHVHMHI